MHCPIHCTMHCPIGIEGGAAETEKHIMTLFKVR